MDERFARFMVSATRIQLQIDQYFAPDMEPPADYRGPHLIAIAHANRIVTLGSTGRIVRELPYEASAALLKTAAHARTEQIYEGHDTAPGRPITLLTLTVDHARGPAHSFMCSALINHHAPHALPPQWSALLRQMRDRFDYPDEATALDWDRALTWTSPVDLGPVWQAGKAVRTPHVVTSIAHDGRLYLRTGQKPYPSSLYKLEGGTLTCMDDRRVVPPVKDGGPGRCHAHFVLPCGGGTVTLHRDWEQTPRIVLRCSDIRGLYVQSR